MTTRLAAEHAAASGELTTSSPAAHAVAVNATLVSRDRALAPAPELLWLEAI
ncbi:MAG TPA: hypothetical protein PLB25_17500 [Rhodoferax sp.]|nr:hypothetical protein [Rhodoferax sp.]